MKRAGGITLLEATIGSAVAMVGIVALIQISRSLLDTTSEIRTQQGQPAIAERLIRDQLAFIKSPTYTPCATVSPLALPGVVYTLQLDCSNAPTYSIKVLINGREMSTAHPSSGTIWVVRGDYL
ncbi:MAG: hypothetical protein HY692_05135 [Cyanobacteria bacterium NC_groundwater_1444_Ag_S-0.65um_54_12]|nr:hypothetical protein [Cyanobacteria bacterium NC_groundwater_1444_Ag_S-0.65um_54_12]